MSIDHRRFHVTMAQQLLHRSDVVAVLQQVPRKRMPEGMTTGRLRDSSLESSHLNRPLQDSFVQMVPAFLSRDSVGILGLLNSVLTFKNAFPLTPSLSPKGRGGFEVY